MHGYDEYPQKIYRLWSCLLQRMILVWLWKYCFVGTASPFKANHIIFIHCDTAAVWAVSFIWSGYNFVNIGMKGTFTDINIDAFSAFFMYTIPFFALCTLKGEVVLFLTSSNFSLLPLLSRFPLVQGFLHERDRRGRSAAEVLRGGKIGSFHC